MQITDITPDQVILWQWGLISINATLAYTWLVMTFMTLGSWLVTRRLSSQAHMPRWQNLLEVVVSGIRDQIQEVSGQDPRRYLPFIGTLFLFIGVANLLSVVPGYLPPTGSLSTTTALAVCVFVAVPVYGIAHQGLGAYLKNYLTPTPLMLPFNLIGELSRTLALAVRLFGNVMSGAKIAAVLLAIMPLFFPILMQLLGLLTGLIQAYIFAILAMVYIASATRVSHERPLTQQPQAAKKGDEQHG